MQRFLNAPRAYVAVIATLTGLTAVAVLSFQPEPFSPILVSVTFMSVCCVFLIGVSSAWKSWLDSPSPRWLLFLKTLFLDAITLGGILVFVVIGIRLLKG